MVIYIWILYNMMIIKIYQRRIWNFLNNILFHSNFFMTALVFVQLLNKIKIIINNNKIKKRMMDYYTLTIFSKEIKQQNNIFKYIAPNFNCKMNNCMK